ncbi:MAG: selenocysteine-specific translation elongation factor, partial [Dehalococcoidia bacterium]
MYVIGTAGHVDHGKSALIKAPTGIDPDRLREEKERGLTIDLGFAWLNLPSGQEVSIVDVPGHERFIKNMLAGVGGIDLALLVIAADEGVMPQTREHLAIVDLLQIRRGVVVVSKMDLVDADWLELVKADAEKVVRGTILAGSPLVACSATTGQGLDGLLAAMEAELARTPPKRDIGRPRLPIDRAFTVAGFGTVVTGTLSDGSFTIGQEVEVVPGGMRSRIRGLQTHGKKVEAAPPGRRTAVNLPGVAVEELRRGMAVTAPGWLKPTTAVDVRLRAVAYLPRPIRHNLTITFHSGSAEVQGRILLLDRDQVPPGETAWAQVRLAEAVAVAKGDYFVVRDPNDTLGGGRVVDTQVRRHRRFHAPILETLATLERGSPGDLLLVALGRLEPTTLRGLSRQVDLSSQEVRASIEKLIASGQALALDQGNLGPESILYMAPGFARLGEQAGQILAAYHRQHSLRTGMPKEELRTRLGLEHRTLDLALNRWLESGQLRETGGAIGLPDHQARLTPEQERRVAATLRSLAESPYAPPTDALPEPELLAYLEEQGQLVRVGEGVVFATDAHRDMVERIVAHLKENGTITLAQVRDMFG